MNKNISNILSFFNPWWDTGRVGSGLALPFLRPVFYKLVDYLDLGRVIILKGPRRTGKSTLMFQLIDWLILKNVNPKSILFISFDDQDARVKLDEILDSYGSATLLNYEDGQLFCFLDEVHLLPNWQEQVKKYYDHRKNITFIISSSAASLLQSQTESLAGRTIEEAILPFSFYEFVSYQLYERREGGESGGNMLRAIDGLSKLDWQELATSHGILPFINQIKIYWEMFIRFGGFPHILKVEDDILRVKLLRDDIVDKAIYRDIVSRFNIKESQILEKIFLYCVSISGNILNVSNLSKTVGMKSRLVAGNYLMYLKNSYLLFTIPKYSASLEPRLRSPEKIYAIDGGFLSAFQYDRADKGIENFVATALKARFIDLGYWRKEYELDFVFKDELRRLCAVEVKYSNHPSSVARLKGIGNFKKKYKPDVSIVVTKDYLVNEGDLFFIPAWLFLLRLRT